MTFISYNLLKNENYIHESFVFPTKPNNELHGGKGVFQKESASFVIGVSNLDWGYRVVNCDTGMYHCRVHSFFSHISQLPLGWEIL